jgi:hypothetical protein
MIALLVALLLWGVYKPAAPSAAETLVLTVRQTVGMSPFTLRFKVRASTEGREVCVTVDGPEYHRACRELWGVTWTQDFQLRAGGDYVVYATNREYQTPDIPVKVIGLEGSEP